METLLEVLRNRDGETEAKDAIEEMVDRLLEGEHPEEILYDYGLEPDYVIDLIHYATPVIKHT